MPKLRSIGRLCNVDQFCCKMSLIMVLLGLSEFETTALSRETSGLQLVPRSEAHRRKVFIMATNLSTCHPGDGIEALNRLPGLADPLLQIDFERELQQLRLKDSWQRETGRSSKTLAKYPDFRIVLILMKSGTRMRQHRAEGRISIQQLKGQVCIHLADRNMTLSTGHLLVLDCGVLHDVEALEESALLLTISWRRQKSGASESFSSAQRHLDEEAVSRMDDEGGGPGATVSPPA
jgi:quercetin dioxygenase-like cupin family protein